MRFLRRYALLAASLMLAPGLSARADESVPCPAPCPTACTTPCPVVHTAAPKVIVEVPPPNVVIRPAAACAPACAPKECFLKQICHFGCKPHAGHAHYTVPLAPVVPAAPAYAPVYAAPIAPAYSYAPVAPAAPAYAPVAPAYAAPTFAAPTYAAPTYAAPTFAAPVAPPAAPPVQPVYVPVYAGTPPTAPVTPPVTPPTTPAADTCDAALKRITAQMETLTKVVETHTVVLTSHEDRIKRLEKWADEATKANKLPLPKLDELPK